MFIVMMGGWFQIFAHVFHQQSVAADLSHAQNNICQLASGSDNAVTLPFENGSNEKGANLMMMRGMTAKDFDPVRYSGRWFEVASLKRGFAGQGQEDCHCTQVNAKINIAVNILEDIWFRK